MTSYNTLSRTSAGRLTEDTDMTGGPQAGTAIGTTEHLAPSWVLSLSSSV